jgi:hypothetical protein
MLEEIQKMTEKSLEMLNRLRKNISDREVKKVAMLHRACIITRNEARHLLGLDPIKELEFQSFSPKFQLVKSARNRYDYLNRKLNDGKYFTKQDEEDFIVLQKMFKENSSELSTISENSATVSDENSDAQTRINTHFQTNSAENNSDQLASGSLRYSAENNSVHQKESDVKKNPQTKEEKIQQILENIQKIDEMQREIDEIKEENSKIDPQNPKISQNYPENPKKWVSMAEFGGMLGVDVNISHKNTN